MPGNRQQIRFVTTSDGVRIAHATTGEGPAIVKAANFLNHLEFDMVSPVWRPSFTELSREHTLVRYDGRGCGLSDREVPELSFEALLRDLETVVDALELERFVLLGLSQGGAVGIAYASIFVKLGAETRAQAIVRARDAGFGRHPPSPGPRS